MAYFKPRQEKRKLPSVPEGSPIGTATLYDVFIESLWRRTMNEYARRGIGYNAAGEIAIPYPDKEVWWDDPRSRLPLLREFNKYYPKEVLEKERLLKEATDTMEREFEELQIPKRQGIKVRGAQEDRTGGRGRA